MEIKFTGKIPSEQEYVSLTCAVVEKSRSSEIERNTKTRQSLKHIGTGLVWSVLLPLFIFLLNNILPSDVYEDGRWIFKHGWVSMIFVFIGAAFIIYALVCLAGMAVSPRAKDSETALNNYVKRVLFGEDNELTNDLKSKNPDYAYEILGRMIPVKLMPARQTFTQYLNTFRADCLDLVSGHYKAVFDMNPDNYETNYTLAVKTDVLSEEVLAEGIVRKAVKTELFHASDVKLNIFHETEHKRDLTVGLNFDMIFVQSGKFWYVYDPMPEYVISSEVRE
ncbi:MAG: hypothetical protein FWF82_05360 [Oscillospiraceae bacterium]|nr:hypothetical protein [Oscillospiraceae bacterium]